MSVGDSPIRSNRPPEARPEWVPIYGRRDWWLHRDGIRKSYCPDGSRPDPEQPDEASVEEILLDALKKAYGATNG